MNLKLKKIIAREFLIIVALIILSFTSFVGTYLYNKYLINKKVEIENQIDIQLDSISNLTEIGANKLEFKNWVILKSLTENRKQLLRILYSRYAPQQELSEARLIAINRKYGEDNIRLAEDFYNKYLRDNREVVGIDSLNFKIASEILNTITKQRSLKRKIETQILSKEEQREIGLDILIYLTFIFFPIRYFYYGIRWSIKTLYYSKN